MTLCMCGCGQQAQIATENRPDRGWVKGEPRRYLRGHNARTPEMRELLSDVKRGSLNPNWKGDEASVASIHDWLNVNHPRSGTCEECGRDGWTDYANISGRYTRRRADYRELCRRCHMTLDADARSRAPSGKWHVAEAS